MAVERIGVASYFLADDLGYKPSRIRSFALQNKRRATFAEIEISKILRDINQGVLKDRFTTQHVISGKWIVDIFFSEIRLAVEIDGNIHRTVRQIEKDHQKEQDCKEFDITLIRISNEEVFGDRSALLQKLRNGWRKARCRENKWIGKPYERAKLPSTPR